MQKTKRKFKTVIKIFLYIFLGIALIVGGFIIFILLGKDKALNLELKGISMETVADGVYSGGYEGLRFSNTVEVTVKNHRITDIQVLKSQVFIKDTTVKELTGRIINAQNTDIDIVSGATADSNAFLIAVENALKSSKPVR